MGSSEFGADEIGLSAVWHGVEWGETGFNGMCFGEMKRMHETGCLGVDGIGWDWMGNYCMRWSGMR